MFSQDLLNEIRAHARASYPRECCGLVILRHGKPRYIKCRNSATGNEHFIIDPVDYAIAEDLGEIIRIVHSHPGETGAPSDADIMNCDMGGIPWLIYGDLDDQFHERIPRNYIPPLTGRVFQHGTTDCYGLVRDYYRKNLDIVLPNYLREDMWWANGGNLYLENFANAGFIEVVHEPIEEHDVLLMKVMSPVPNHAAVYTGEGEIIHHLYDRLSTKDTLSLFWQRAIFKIVRHRSLKHA